MKDSWWRATKLADLVKNLRAGGVLRIAGGGADSGGERTLRNILVISPKWKQVVDIQPHGPSAALNKLRDRQIDAFFVMDSPNSPLSKQVKESI